MGRERFWILDCGFWIEGARTTADAPAASVKSFRGRIPPAAYRAGGRGPVPSRRHPHVLLQLRREGGDRLRRRHQRELVFGQLEEMPAPAFTKQLAQLRVILQIR